MVRTAASKRWLWIVVAALVALLALAAGGIWYGSHYANRALPRTHVGSVDVAGMNRAQLKSLLQQKNEQSQVSVQTPDGKFVANLNKIGTPINVDDTIKKVLEPNRSVGARFKALFSARTVDPVVSPNLDATQDFVLSILPEGIEQAKNAQVVRADDGKGFSVKPGQVGRTLDTKALVAAGKKAALSLQSGSVKAAYEDREPDITDADAQQLADKAMELSQTNVQIKYEDESIVPSISRRTEWVDLKPSGEKALKLNAEAVSKWVQKAADDYVNQEPQNGQRRVNKDGKVIQTVSQPQEGRSVNNVDKVAADMMQAIEAGKDYEGAFTAKTTEAKWDEKVVAPAAESLYYKASDGEKWIDINLSNFTVTAFNGGTPEIGPIPMVPGAPGWETVTGIHRIYLKYPTQTMRGTDFDGSEYETPGVPSVMYFSGNYALHGAPWRGSFGYAGSAGSHGCVNLPVGSAAQLYEWAPMGTVVASHY
ncbi:L,D-transpeptidase family protein [Gleimia hominis]|uniref:L,D-transpeptidase family protein n=1 Tax=Gleimia hominis TaxID=595468 RepID=A0ABU3I902_9ACTO|nr:L,D-transpeptidase family protein [Gleimia hominis]MDT3766849.1 L,D-transpeptidase family protein [Gleimia hominis]